MFVPGFPDDPSPTRFLVFSDEHVAYCLLPIAYSSLNSFARNWY